MLLKYVKIIKPTVAKSFYIDLQGPAQVCVDQYPVVPVESTRALVDNTIKITNQNTTLKPHPYIYSSAKKTVHTEATKIKIDQQNACLDIEKISK